MLTVNAETTFYYFSLVELIFWFLRFILLTWPVTDAGWSDRHLAFFLNLLSFPLGPGMWSALVTAPCVRTGLLGPTELRFFPRSEYGFWWRTCTPPPRAVGNRGRWETQVGETFGRHGPVALKAAVRHKGAVVFCALVEWLSLTMIVCSKTARQGDLESCYHKEMTHVWGDKQWWFLFHHYSLVCICWRITHCTP